MVADWVRSLVTAWSTEERISFGSSEVVGSPETPGCSRSLLLLTPLPYLARRPAKRCVLPHRHVMPVVPDWVDGAEQVVVASTGLLPEHLDADQCARPGRGSRGPLRDQRRPRGRAAAAAGARSRCLRSGSRRCGSCGPAAVDGGGGRRRPVVDQYGPRRLWACRYPRGGVRAAAAEWRLAAGLAVHQASVRDLAPAEVELISVLVGRCRESLQRVQADEGGRESERRHRLLVERASDAIWVLDRDSRFVEVKPAACVLLPDRGSGDLSIIARLSLAMPATSAIRSTSSHRSTSLPMPSEHNHGNKGSRAYDMNTRAEFSEAVKRVIAGRAGYQCSIPNCGLSTIGPDRTSNGLMKTGMAAHIYAAAHGGPRGTGGLSTDERSSPENGIWCCYNHGKAVDANRGNAYSATLLKAWKRLHEARKGAEVHGMAVDRFGLVESITINSGPVPLAGRTFELDMRNVIIGPNDSGKTALARLIASIANPDHVADLSKTRDVDIAVRWFDPDVHEVLTCGRSGDVRQVLDGEPVPYVARPYKTILLSGLDPISRTGLAPLAQLFDLSATAMKATLEALPATSDVVKEVRVIGSRVEFILDIDGRAVESSFGQPSPNAFLYPLVLLDIAGIHAQRHARVEPTFLLVDELLDFLHPELQVAALERIERAADYAQVAIISHSPTVAKECERSWKLTALESSTKHDVGSPPHAVDFAVRAIDPTDVPLTLSRESSAEGS